MGGNCYRHCRIAVSSASYAAVSTWTRPLSILWITGRRPLPLEDSAATTIRVVRDASGRVSLRQMRTSHVNFWRITDVNSKDRRVSLVPGDLVISLRAHEKIIVTRQLGRQRTHHTTIHREHASNTRELYNPKQIRVYIIFYERGIGKSIADASIEIFNINFIKSYT